MLPPARTLALTFLPTGAFSESALLGLPGPPVLTASFVALVLVVSSFKGGRLPPKLGTLVLVSSTLGSISFGVAHAPLSEIEVMRPGKPFSYFMVFPP